LTLTYTAFNYIYCVGVSAGGGES